jgi:molybdopterin-guanine dinucleotide biosynthesis protein A
MSAGAMRAQIAGAILAGGSARRLNGAAKGLMRFGGDRAIDRVAAALLGFLQGSDHSLLGEEVDLS